MTSFKESLRLFIPIVCASTVLIFISYINDQQILRLGANEPQKALAEDLAAALANTPGSTYTNDAHVAIESSLSPYLVIYDSYGKPIGGTGYLDGKLPTIPAGLFDVARTKGEETLSWQPEAGVRSAVVLVPIASGGSGFVMGGKSLAYVEQEEAMLGKRDALGWLGTMIITLAACWVVSNRRRHR